MFVGKWWGGGGYLASDDDNRGSPRTSSTILNLTMGNGILSVYCGCSVLHIKAISEISEMGARVSILN